MGMREDCVFDILMCAMGTRGRDRQFNIHHHVYN